ncbi:FKBP-type peptidyl-prolyl cis-trans isomerase [Colwellia piezophila]|uniref:FKBP-type peptidyl-prolyl cis-trans isomerase n=1 Tax=Colwellia piezophila TaxID=211668 RepID=UPI00036BD8B6|nr:FKBP-type peptidyl-prolyl cis-trans isomerase [Colwellia piezophila]
MLLRILLVSFTCILMVGCASSNSTGSLYSPAEANAIKAKHWLTFNLKREGVASTASGLQYKVLEKSAGCKPDTDYKVTVHYKMLSVQSKKIIDSSYQRGNPDKFQLSKMVKGWREGVPMMKVGETWELYMPSHLAYGSRGLPGSVAPNSVLISQITLVDARCQD